MLLSYLFYSLLDSMQTKLSRKAQAAETLSAYESNSLAVYSSHQPHANVFPVTSWHCYFGVALWGSRLQLFLKDINIFYSRGAPAIQQDQGHLGAIPGSSADLLYCFAPFSSSKQRSFPGKFVILGVRLPFEDLSHNKEFGVMGLAY